MANSLNSIIAFAYLTGAAEAFKKLPELSTSDIQNNLNDMKYLRNIFKEDSKNDGYNDPKSLVESAKKSAYQELLNNVSQTSIKNTTAVRNTSPSLANVAKPPNMSKPPNMTQQPNMPKPPNMTQQPNMPKPPNSTITPNMPKPPNSTITPNMPKSPNIQQPTIIQPNVSALNPMSPPPYIPTPNTLGGRRKSRK